MEQDKPKSTDEQKQPQGQGYIATILGANVGFILGAILALMLMVGYLPIDFSAGLSTFALILSYVFLTLIGGALGGLLGAYLVLASKGYPRRKRTLLYMIAFYPLTLIFLGADFLISALFVPALARWVALKF